MVGKEGPCCLAEAYEHGCLLLTHRALLSGRLSGAERRTPLHMPTPCVHTCTPALRQVLCFPCVQAAASGARALGRFFHAVQLPARTLREGFASKGVDWGKVRARACLPTRALARAC